MIRARVASAVVAAMLAGIAPMAAASGGPNTAPDDFSSTYQPVPHAQLHELATVPTRTLRAVGLGVTLHGRAHRPQRITAKPLRRSGKPELVFIDAEFCPYCASVRWGLTEALDRFGTFSGITTMHSSTTDVDPDIQTLSYRYAGYHSRFLAFDPIVMEDLHQHRVQSPPPHLKRIWLHYTGQGTFPFLDFGGRLVLLASPINPGRLRGQSRPVIAAALAHPRTSTAQAVDGEANVFTAAICTMTGGKPGRICAARYVTAIEKAFPNYRASQPY